jgi:hypothetical protein
LEINFLEIAQKELDDAIEYYNHEVHDLGDAFLIEVLNALDRIGKFPEAWASMLKTNQKMPDPEFYLWNNLPNAKKRNLDRGNCKSPQKAGLLEESNLKLAEILIG